MKRPLDLPRPRRSPLRRAACGVAAALLAAGFLVASAEPPAVEPVFHASFQSASAAAAADQSLVLLIFSAEWCGPCKLLKQTTLQAPEFLHQESPLHIADVDIDDRQKMAHDFAVDAVPTLILLTGDGKVVQRQTGYQTAADLLAWLKTGRARAAAGQWEGTVPSAPLDDFVKKAAADKLTTNDLQRLVVLLGDPDPANREGAGKILLDQREQAVPALIEAVGDAYLGVRIGAAELLQRLAPNLPAVDPWQSPPQMSNTVAVLQKWWTQTGKLPPMAAPRPKAAATDSSVKEALERLQGDDPVSRTAAMTELLGYGADALPAVREALKRAERTGDQRTLGLLEDVRWTLLVPDAVEQQSGGVRNLLARGKSSERQAAAERLGRLGRSALGVLVELAGDGDPLVVETTIHALSGIGGDDSVSAIATLLQSSDSNLRMTAAQALGHTKNALALKPLLAAAADSDEVVACTALSGIEEAEATEAYSRSPRDFPKELTAGLRRSLADPRWRVRAAAAETVGKLADRDLTGDVKKLLGDSDGFVVKSALTALGELNDRPAPERLAEVSHRLPSLQGDVVESMLAEQSDDSAKTVSDLFKSGNTETRLAILNAFLRRGFYDNEATDERWKPMFTQAVAASDPRLRRTAAEVLDRLSPKLAAPLIGTLLGDEDRETRQTAALVALKILADNRAGSSRSRVFFSSFNGTAEVTTNKLLVDAPQQAAWHAALLQRTDPSPDLGLAAAIFATGDGRTDLSLLLAALNRTNAVAGALSKPNESAAIAAVLPKLSLPAALPVLERLSHSPVWYALAVSANASSPGDVQNYLLDPARFKSAVEPATGADLTECLGFVAGYDYAYSEPKRWSLWTEDDHVKALALALAQSTNAAWRTVAVFSLGLRSDARDNLAVIQKAVADPNPWVRGSAVRALARNLRDRTALEAAIAPLLADTNATVASTVAVALLEPETRTAAGLESESDYFQFEGSAGGRSQSTAQNDSRPLTVLDSHPPYLASARKWLAATSGEASGPFALLLAQFGDFSGVDLLVPQVVAADVETDRGERTLSDMLLTGIALSHDAKYLPTLKQMAAVRHQEWALRKVLQALKGMSGPEARQLRFDLNKKIQNAGGGSAESE